MRITVTKVLDMPISQPQKRRKALKGNELFNRSAIADCVCTRPVFAKVLARMLKIE